MTKRWLIFIVAWIVGGTAQADLMLDSNLNISQMSMGPTVSNDVNIYSRLGVYVNPSRSSFYLGVGLDYLSQSIKTQSSDSYNATEYYLGVKWSPTRSRWLFLGASIAPTTQGTFQPTSGGSQVWQGTSEIFSVSCYYPTESGLMLGLSLDYYYASFNRQISGGTSTSASQSISAFFPGISIGWAW